MATGSSTIHTEAPTHNKSYRGMGEQVRGSKGGQGDLPTPRRACFLCDGSHRAYDFPKKERLISIVKEDEERHEKAKMGSSQLLGATRAVAPSTQDEGKSCVVLRNTCVSSKVLSATQRSKGLKLRKNVKVWAVGQASRGRECTAKSYLLGECKGHNEATVSRTSRGLEKAGLEVELFVHNSCKVTLDPAQGSLGQFSCSRSTCKSGKVLSATQ